MKRWNFFCSIYKKKYFIFMACISRMLRDKPKWMTKDPCAKQLLGIFYWNFYWKILHKISRIFINFHSRKILNGANRNHWTLFNMERVKTMWNLRSTKKIFLTFFNSGMNNRFKVTSLWRQKQQPSPSMRALISKLRS